MHIDDFHDERRRSGNGGRGGIRTHGTVSRSLDFESSALSRTQPPFRWCTLDAGHGRGKLILLIIGRTDARRLLARPVYCAAVIDREDLLSAFVADLEEAEWTALDTEADSLHAYPEKLCLIQITIPGQDVLVDPLAQLDLSGLFAALNRHTILMHGADYDVRLFKLGHDFVPNRIFDTMLAARLTGRTSFGLSHLCQEILGVELEKTSQKANWAQRPLTEKMEEYARNDTRHLRPLVDALRDELRAKGRTDWHAQECDRLVRDNSAPRKVDPDQVWRIKGSAKLEPRALAVLRELWNWREKEAQRRNRPPFFILTPDAMIKMSESLQTGKDANDFIPKRMPEHRRREVQRCIKAGRAVAENDCPAKHRPPPRKHISPAQKKRFEEIQSRRNREAEKLEIDPTIIASRATMVRLACEADGVFEDVLPWQRALLGVD